MIRNAPLALIMAFAAGPAMAAEPPADAPTATGTAKGDPGVAAQIAAFLADSPVAQLPATGGPVANTAPAISRAPHGVVEVAVGNHGYRSVYLESHMPLGDNGQLSIAVGEERGGYAGYGGYGRRLAIDRSRIGAAGEVWPSEVGASPPEPPR